MMVILPHLMAFKPHRVDFENMKNLCSVWVFVVTEPTSSTSHKTHSATLHEKGYSQDSFSKDISVFFVVPQMCEGDDDDNELVSFRFQFCLGRICLPFLNSPFNTNNPQFGN